MEVEVELVESAAAPKRSENRSAIAAAAGHDWPMKCICNLCSCGGHSCDSFALRAADANSYNNNHNRLSGGRLSGATGDDDNDDDDDDDGNHDDDGRRSSGGCQLLPLQHQQAERYLPARAKSVGRPSRKKQQQQQRRRPIDSDDESSVHFLVTRPEIASKPRDHILFEGDMDLKTTFETSYEALAKLRLAGWKKQQQQQQRAANKEFQPVGGNKREPAPARSTSLNRHHLVRRQAGGSRSPAQASRRARERRQERDDEGAELGGGGDHDDDGDEHEGCGERRRPREKGVSRSRVHTPARPLDEQPARRERSKTPLEVANTNHNIHDDSGYDAAAAAAAAAGDEIDRQLTKIDHQTNNELYSANRRGLSKHHDHSSQQLFGSDQPLPPQQPKEFAPDQQRQQQRRQQPDCGQTAAPPPPKEAAGYVDPDLAPIIVYDANMNRLERVGMRKRSKYRPSTSLRPGARGLFGDQMTDKEEMEAARAAQGSRVEDKAMQTEATEFGEQQQKQLEEIKKQQPQPVRKQQISRSSAQLNARNLRGSSQAHDCLVYTDHNLPVNSRRRVAGNVNMRDHIREQSIVERSPSSRLDSRPAPPKSTTTVSPINGLQTGSAAAFTTLDREDLADVRLAEQEEAAAVAEIQRVTAQDLPTAMAAAAPASSQLQHQQQHSSALTDSKYAQGGGEFQQQLLLAAASGGGETRASSRQSRLQRTCQEQSFHISQNEYPEPKEVPPPACYIPKSRSSAMNSTHASPQSRVYNNLFRESPDFILTTGGPFMSTNEPLSPREAGHEKGDDYLQYNTTNETSDNTRLLMDSSRGHLADSRASAAAMMMSGAADDDQYRHFHDFGASGAGRDSYECKVAKLGERFQYVGSKSGHKYFVEKILESE